MPEPARSAPNRPSCDHLATPRTERTTYNSTLDRNSPTPMRQRTAEDDWNDY